MRVDQWWYTIPLRVRSLFRKRCVEQELDDELRYHVEQHTAQLVARGMNAADARTEALRAIGGTERRKEECREERRVTVIEHLIADARYAVRRLARTPGFTAVALITLALGLGANAAIFSVVNGVLLRPLAYHEPDRLVSTTGTIAPGDFLDWRAHNRTFEGIGAAEWWSPTLTGGERPEQVTALRISSDILPLLGVQPMLGRFIRADEELAGAAPVVVLSYGSWKMRFAADSAVLGKTMVFNGTPHTIIGVMPDGFRFAPYWATQAELWAPLGLDARKTDRSASSMRTFGRLAKGATLEQARADLASILASVDASHAEWARSLNVVPLKSLVIEDVDKQLAILQVAVMVLLLIACANVAHLQLMRAAAGERECAVRVALGASGARVVQQSLVESAVLCVGGAALGAGLGYAGVRMLIAFAPPGLPRVDSIAFDGTVFAYLAGFAALAALISGIAPAVRASRVRVGDATRASRASSDTPRRRRVRNALVVSEFALTLVLLAATGLVLRSYAAMMRVEPGFDPAHTVAMEVSLRGTQHAAVAARDPFFRELVTRAEALPGVVGASMTNHIPIFGDHWPFPYAIEGRPLARPGAEPRALFRIARPAYFATMRIPILRGRDFSVEDERGSARVAIVNQAMARRNWPGGDPVGQRLTVADPKRGEWYTVIGVAGNVRQGRWVEDSADEMYFPYLAPSAGPEDGLLSYLSPDRMTLVIRANGDPLQAARAASDLINSMDADAAVANTMTLDAIIATQFVSPTFYLMLLSAFACVALLLAAVGVYGVISYSVAQRTRELGVRVALGAGRSGMFGLVMKQGLGLAALGSAIGLVAALLTTRFARALLFGVEPTDAVTFAVVCAVLTGVALLASYFPARRAARVDPVIALRAE